MNTIETKEKNGEKSNNFELDDTYIYVYIRRCYEKTLN